MTFTEEDIKKEIIHFSDAIISIVNEKYNERLTGHESAFNDLISIMVSSHISSLLTCCYQLCKLYDVDHIPIDNLRDGFCDLIPKVLASRQAEFLPPLAEKVI